jgi:hypothetical protein
LTIVGLSAFLIECPLISLRHWLERVLKLSRFGRCRELEEENQIPGGEEEGRKWESETGRCSRQRPVVFFAHEASPMTGGRRPCPALPVDPIGVRRHHSPA